MCYEERFFRDRAMKAAQQRNEETKPVKEPAPPSVQPVRPAPETKKHKEVEREPELV